MNILSISNNFYYLIYCSNEANKVKKKDKVICKYMNSLLTVSLQADGIEQFDPKHAIEHFMVSFLLSISDNLIKM